VLGVTITFGSLFAGCGGGDLGLERAGMECEWQVEIDPMCRKVLEKHWPHVSRFCDVHDVGRHNLEAVDLIIGGFPCQPFSSAGKQRGTEDDRWLWPQMERVIEELRPRWVIGENTPGVDRLALGQIISGLEGIGYKVGPPLEIPACAIGADHLRYRTWILGYSNHEGAPEMPINDETSRVPEAIRRHTERGRGSLGRNASGIGRVGEPIPGYRIGEQKNNPGGMGGKDGLPGRMDRLRMIGNAMHVDAVEMIGRAIMEATA